MMPVYDYICEKCGTTIETVRGIDVDEIKCHRCGGEAHRIISLRSHNTFNEDAGWIKDVLEVVDKKGKEPETKEFLRNPTRSNMKAWMKARGLRHMDQGEEKERPEIVNKVDRERRLKFMLDRHMKRTALEVRS